MKLIAAVLVVLLFYFIQKVIYSKYWEKGLSTDVRFSKEFIECGEHAELIESVTNDKNLPLPIFQFKTSVDRNLRFEDMENSVVTDRYYRNDIFSLLGRQKVERKLVFEATHRGIYAVDSINVLAKDFFLVSTFATSVDSDARIIVFPKKLDISALDPMFRGILGEIQARHSVVEDSLTFRGIRDYRTSDGYRSINWKQSAKSINKLKVNVYDFTMDAEVRILVNLDTETMIETDRLLETSISIASSAVRRFLLEHVKVSVNTNGTKEEEGSEILPNPGAGAELSHSATIDKYLAGVKGSAGTEAFLTQLDREKIERGERVLYLIISPYYKEDLLQKLDSLERAGLSVVMVVPYYDKHGFHATRPWMYGWKLSLIE